MKISVRLLILLIFFLVTLLGGFIYQWEKQKQQQDNILKLQAEQFAETFKTVVDLKTAKIHSYIHDYSYWDDMVHFARSGDSKWARINLEETVDDFETDYICVIGQDSKVVYEFGVQNQQLLNAVKSYPYNFAKPVFQTFFVKTDEGPFEIFIAPIQYGEDSNRVGKPQGYFIGAKHWDAKFIREFETITHQHVELKKNDHTQYDLEHPLFDANHQKIYSLGIILDSSTSDALEAYFKTNLYTLSVIFWIAMVVAGWVIYNYIVDPIRKITLSMRTSDMNYLEGLSKKQDEFGQIARLVEEFAEQNKQLQEEIIRGRVQDQLLIQQNRMAAMGEMIGNIAHQWRQPLNTLALIVQDSEDAFTYGELNEEYVRSMIDKAMAQISFMSKTIEDFRNFYSPDKEKQRFVLKDNLLKAINLVNQSLEKENVRYTFEVDETIQIDGYPNEFIQVIVNLIQNACDAIVERQSPKRLVQINGYEENGEIHLKISDSGGGIDPEILGKIFDPYFTTKPNGTGIGLYMSKMIIEKYMDGRFEVTNHGDGVQMQIIIPSGQSET